MAWWDDRALTRERSLRAATTIGSGLFLTAIIMLFETAEQPIAGASLEAICNFIVRSGLLWFGFGLCWAFFAALTERRLSPAAMVPAVGVAALLITGFGLLLNRALSDELPYSILGGAARISHFLWINVFFGSLYVVSFSSVRSVLRSRNLFARVRLARGQSLATMEEMRLETFRGQLQPQIILDAIATIRGLYQTSPSRADGLVDDLVGFLRLAVRSLKTEQTTLSTELDLAGYYLHLRSSLLGDIGDVSVDVTRSPQLNFPGGLLMPLIEQLCLAGGRSSLAAGLTKDTYCVVLRADGVSRSAVSDRLLRRVESVSATYGSAVISQIADDNGDFLWTLRVAAPCNQAQQQAMET